MLAAVDVKGSERLIDRSVVEAEELHYLRGRKGITERIVAPDEIELRQPLLEPFTDRGFIAPQDRRGHPGRRNECRNGLEHLPDETLWSPVGHGNGSPRRAHSQQFLCNKLRPWREHRA